MKPMILSVKGGYCVLNEVIPIKTKREVSLRTLGTMHHLLAREKGPDQRSERCKMLTPTRCVLDLAFSRLIIS